MKLARGMVYGFSSSDPVMVAAAAASLAAIALAGSVVPAWRATTVDPVQAVRAE